ncbi:MAG: carboxypeptidase regulatory-like domain-containing protein [Deltaproteobacteria bacterium]|nr:carboxypeptidase regulatory-like domain-containing protein [Deltaproteobacteria bacterium]
MQGRVRIVLYLFFLLVVAPGFAWGGSSYVIKASGGSGGSIDPKGSVTVAAGADQAFNITASQGYEISDVKVDGKSKGKIGTFTFEDIQAKHTITAAFKKLKTYTISGKVTSTCGSGLGGITIELSDSNGDSISETTTNSGGQYSFKVTATGEYTLTPYDDNYSFSPEPLTVNVSRNIPGKNFTASTGETEDLIEGEWAGADPYSGYKMTLSVSGSTFYAVTTNYYGGDYEWFSGSYSTNYCKKQADFTITQSSECPGYKCGNIKALTIFKFEDDGDTMWLATGEPGSKVRPSGYGNNNKTDVYLLLRDASFTVGKYEGTEE